MNKLVKKYLNPSGPLYPADSNNIYLKRYRQNQPNFNASFLYPNLQLNQDVQNSFNYTPSTLFQNLYQQSKDLFYNKSSLIDVNSRLDKALELDINRSKRKQLKREADVRLAFDAAGGNIDKMSSRELILYKALLNGETIPSIVTATAIDINDSIKSSGIEKAFGGIDGITSMTGNITRMFDKNNRLDEQSTTTKALNNVYDKTANVVSKLGPVGSIVGNAMKIGGAVSDGLTALGVGTDGQTVQDRILDSKFLKLTPFGLVNAFGAQSTDSLKKDKEVFAQVGTAFTGTELNVDNAVKKAGKKYGLFSRRKMREENKKINEARRQQRITGDIADNATQDFLTLNSMSDIYANRQGFLSRGGWNNRMAIGRSGIKLELANRAKDVLKCKKGNLVPKPKNRTLEELIEYAKKENPRFIQRISEPVRDIEFVDKDGNTVRGTHYMAYNTFDDGYFVYPTIQEDEEGNLKKYTPLEAEQRALKNRNGLWFNTEEEARLFSEGYKQGWPEFFNRNWSVEKKKEGGVVKSFINAVNPFELEISEIEPADPSTIIEDNEIQEFQKGGSINVIPEGALHARKHEIDLEHITKKGIPVVSEDEDGNIEQHAEVERSEIILRLALTEKLEKLCKIYYSDDFTKKEKEDAALEAGMLLTDEILNNTLDNTNELL